MVYWLEELAVRWWVKVWRTMMSTQMTKVEDLLVRLAVLSMSKMLVEVVEGTTLLSTKRYGAMEDPILSLRHSLVEELLVQRVHWRPHHVLD